MTQTDDRTASAASPGGAAVADGDWRARLRSSRFGTVAVLAITLALVLVGSYLLTGRSGDQAGTAGDGTEKVSAVQLQKAPTGPPPEVGKAAPDFTATTTEGAKLTLSGLRGRPVWLTFGASWCSSCRAEFPDIQAAHAAASTAGAKPGGLAVVGVHLSEDAATVTAYAKRIGLTYPLVPDPQTAVASTYRVMGVPAHVFIDSEGVIRSIDMGILGPDQLRDRLAKIGA